MGRPREWPDGVRVRVLELLGQGWSVREVGVALCIPWSSVQYMKREAMTPRTMEGSDVG